MYSAGFSLRIVVAGEQCKVVGELLYTYLYILYLYTCTDNLLK